MKRLITLITSMTIAFLPLFSPAVVGAIDINRYVCLGVNFGDSAECNAISEGEATTTITTLASDIIDVLSLIVGIVSVIMIILGGLRYITSSGDQGNVTNAKNTILYAIVGLIIVLFSRVIVNFVISRFQQ